MPDEKKRRVEEAWADDADSMLPDRDGNGAGNDQDAYEPDDPYERTYRDGSVKHECAPDEF